MTQMTQADPKPLLDIQDLQITFHTRDGLVTAVDKVSYQVNRGEILAIVGESGSGKSVSCFSILDLLPRPPAKIEQGRIVFDGIDLLACDRAKMQQIRGNRIAMIFQDPLSSLNPNLSIGSQLLEAINSHQSKLDKKAAKDKAISALQEVGISQPEQRLKQYPHEFSGGMKQRVMIAMALVNEPDLLIADEPTTALDVTIQAQIFDLLKALQAKRNIAILFISHDLAVVKQLAHRALVMQKGKIVEQGEINALFANPQHPYTQKLLAAIPTSAKPSEHKFITNNQPPVLEVKQVSIGYPATKQGPDKVKISEWLLSLFRKPRIQTVVHQANFALQQGEILGLVGESGCGKSTLSGAIMQLIQTQSGSISLNQVNLTQADKQTIRSSRKDLQIIFQDPYTSLNPRMSVYDTLLEPLTLHKIVPKAERHARILQLVKEVGLSPQDIRKYPHEFSGGQRQRIAIARALAVEPKVIIADEPVSALDVTVQAQVLNLLLELVKRHRLSMIFISHDLSVVRYLCDRTAVMQKGKIVELAETETLFNQPQQGYTQTLLAAVPSL
jgi:ABC-type microcin C transport system duplicated ATPase subunit YejF